MPRAASRTREDERRLRIDAKRLLPTRRTHGILLCTLIRQPSAMSAPCSFRALHRRAKNRGSQVPSASKKPRSSALDCAHASLSAAQYPRFFANTLNLIRSVNRDPSSTVRSVEPPLTTVMSTSAPGDVSIISLRACRQRSMICWILSSSLRAGIVISSFISQQAPLQSKGSFSRHNSPNTTCPARTGARLGVTTFLGEFPPGARSHVDSNPRPRLPSPVSSAVSHFLLPQLDEDAVA